MTSSWIARAFATLSPGKRYIVGILVNIKFFDAVDGFRTLARKPPGMSKTRRK